MSSVSWTLNQEAGWPDVVETLNPFSSISFCDLYSFRCSDDPFSSRHAIVFATRFMDGSRSLADVLRLVDAHFDDVGLDALDPHRDK